MSSACANRFFSKLNKLSISGNKFFFKNRRHKDSFSYHSYFPVRRENKIDVVRFYVGNKSCR